jgi:UDP-N-acetylglucosamine--N-acetylmuramyl-(pentapeptide) pyrophosphoryl-undecaprenol N-acetylglucosamine transferase
VKLLIAGGGTGGHLFPGIAVAEEFLRRDRGNRVLFVGTERGLEKRVLPTLGYELMTLDVEGVKGRGWARSLGAILKIPRSLLQSAAVLRRFGPDVVLGVGGYASGPAVLAASFLGYPTAVAEQNALPGATNRILGRFVDRAFLTFRESAAEFPARKVLVCGNPVRAAFLAERPAVKRQDDRFGLLVFGGSQGARAINRAMEEAVPMLRDLQNRLRIVHQTGGDDVKRMATVYREAGFPAEVTPFIMDMAGAYDAADLLVCRAGATSLAEITVSGKAALLVPFPFAVGDHQTWNARVLAGAGAAEMVPEKDLTGRLLAGKIRRYVEEPERLRAMEERSRSLGNPRAAADIVDGLLTLAKPGTAAKSAAA